MASNNVNAQHLRKVFANIRDTYGDGRQAVTNAVNQVKTVVENKAADLASKGVDKITSNPFAQRMMKRFNVDPQKLNTMATNAVRKAVGYGLDKLQDAAMNTPVGRKISLIDSGIQGAMRMGNTLLGCDGTAERGCLAEHKAHGVRVLQNENGALEIYFNANYCIDAINTAAKTMGLSYTKEEIAAAVTAALGDEKIMQKSMQEAALESDDAGIREDMGSVHVVDSAVTQPTFFQTPIEGWDKIMKPDASSSAAAAAAAAPVTAAPTSAPVAATQAPSPISSYFVPCRTNCPKSSIPQCGFFQVCF